MQGTSEAGGGLSPQQRREVEAALLQGEVLAARFEPDLDEGLHYAEGLVVLTDRRLLARDPSAAGGWRDWPLSRNELKARERNGLGALELIGPAGLLARWRYTAARAAAAHRLVNRLEAGRAGPAAEGARRAAADSLCPSCGAPLPPDRSDCPECAPKPSAHAAASLRRLWPFARPHLGAGLVGFALTVAATAAGLIPPYLTEPLIDDVLIPRQDGRDVPFSAVGWYLAGMLGATLLAWLLSWARTYVIARVSERISAGLRDRAYAHLLGLSPEFFGGKRTGDLISRIGTDTDRICNFLSINVVDAAADVLMILGTAAILLARAPELAVATLIPLPLALWLVHSVRRRLRHGFLQSSAAWAGMTSVLADTIPGIRVVKAFAQEGRERQRFARANAHVVKVNDRVNTLWSFFGPTIGLLSQLGLLIIWALGAWMIFHRGFAVGTLTMFLAYLGRFYTRLEAMSRLVQATQRAGASAQRLFEILDRVPSVPEPVRPVHPGRLRGEIALRHVGFRYGSRKVLHDIDLHIRPGEMIGLVGHSGAGKSTLVNLICRFFDVAEGAVLVDGHDVRSFPVEEYRRNIGIVLQEPFLFFGSVAENIAYGRPEASREQIMAAARAARAHEFILRLADGYDTPVGERGQSLSGGERQRISIARALLIDPAILILDEATSSVDTETEREIQEALENLIRGRTTIAIAHRLSTLRRADRLVVLERGRIVEVGPHRELLGQPGTYARLHRAQLELVGVNPAGLPDAGYQLAGG